MSLEIALAQAALGRKVFPVLGKRPLVRWTIEATTKPSRLRAWWQVWPDADVGWALPEGVCVVDIDDVTTFLAEGHVLPFAPGQRTSRGLHLLYRCGDDVRQGPIAGGDVKVGGKGYVKIYDSEAFTRWTTIHSGNGTDVAN